MKRILFLLALLISVSAAATDSTIYGVSGNPLSVTGTTSTDHCAKFDASGNLADAGAACGSGSGTVTSAGVTSTSGTLTVTGSPVTASGTINAEVTYGTTANTAAQGNDSRITGAVQSATSVANGGNVATFTPTSTTADYNAINLAIAAGATNTAPFLWRIEQSAAFNSEQDPLMRIGYNCGRPTTTQPSFCWVIESNYNHGTRDLESYWELFSLDGTTSTRPIFYFHDKSLQVGGENLELRAEVLHVKGTRASPSGIKLAPINANQNAYIFVDGSDATSGTGTNSNQYLEVSGGGDATKAAAFRLGGNTYGGSTVAKGAYVLYGGNATSPVAGSEQNTVSIQTGSTLTERVRVEQAGKVAINRPVVPASNQVDINGTTSATALAVTGGTNILTYSQTLSNAAWVASSITKGTDAQTAPDGTATAEKVTASGANGTVLQTVTVLDGDYVFCWFLRRITGSGTVSISVDGTNFSTVTLTTSFQQFCATRNLAAGSTSPTLKLATSGDAVGVWQAQMEPGTVAGPLVLTTSAGIVTTNDLLANGNVKMTRPGSGLYVKCAGAAARCGTATCNGTTEVTVNTTAVGASTQIYFGGVTPGGTPSAPYLTTKTNGTSFGFKCAASDTSVVAWNFVEPIP